MTFYQCNPFLLIPSTYKTTNPRNRTHASSRPRESIGKPNHRSPIPFRRPTKRLISLPRGNRRIARVRCSWLGRNSSGRLNRVGGRGRASHCGPRRRKAAEEARAKGIFRSAHIAPRPRKRGRRDSRFQVREAELE